MARVDELRSILGIIYHVIAYVIYEHPGDHIRGSKDWARYCMLVIAFGPFSVYVAARTRARYCMFGVYVVARTRAGYCMFGVYVVARTRAR